MVTVLFAESAGKYDWSENGGNLKILKEGKSWNIFGKSVTGSNLEKPAGYMAYWFSVGAMFPNIEIYSAHDKD